MYKKKKLRIEADKLWRLAVYKKYGLKCEVCGKKATEPHHFFPKSLYGHLRYNIENGVPLCHRCHFSRHHQGDPIISMIIRNKRGRLWYEELLKKAQNRPKSSYITVKWYKEKINYLTEYLKNDEKSNN